jgi:hypothetical protein
VCELEIDVRLSGSGWSWTWLLGFAVIAADSPVLQLDTPIANLAALGIVSDGSCRAHFDAADNVLCHEYANAAWDFSGHQEIGLGEHYIGYLALVRRYGVPEDAIADFLAVHQPEGRWRSDRKFARLFPKQRYTIAHYQNVTGQGGGYRYKNWAFKKTLDHEIERHIQQASDGSRYAIFDEYSGEKISYGGNPGARPKRVRFVHVRAVAVMRADAFWRFILSESNAHATFDAGATRDERYLPYYHAAMRPLIDIERYIKTVADNIDDPEDLERQQRMLLGPAETKWAAAQGKRFASLFMMALDNPQVEQTTLAWALTHAGANQRAVAGPLATKLWQSKTREEAEKRARLYAQVMDVQAIEPMLARLRSPQTRRLAHFVLVTITGEDHVGDVSAWRQCFSKFLQQGD